METVKRAIRGALEKGDARDRAFRERIYRQAFAALERSLEAQPELSPEAVRERRERVKAIILEIESDFRPAPPPPPPPPPVEHTPEPEPDFVPRVERDDRLSAPEPPDLRDEPPPVLRTRRRRRRRSLALPLLIGVLIAAVAVGGWWTLNGSLLAPIDIAGGGSANRAPSLGSAEESNWITLFTPDDPTSIRTSPGTEASVMRDDDRAFLRVAPGAADSAVSFTIGQGVLERLAGRRVVFSLTARAEEGEETQLSLSCDFGALGTCGRRRYVVGSMAAAEYLFETDLPAARPAAGGTITVVPDIEGRGRALDVFSLRVAVEE